MKPATANLTHTFFVVGYWDERVDKSRPRKKPAEAELVVVRYDSTSKGWRQRCVDGAVATLNNEYVSGETRDDLNAWLGVDFGTSFRVFSHIEEARAYRGR